MTGVIARATLLNFEGIVLAGWEVRGNSPGIGPRSASGGDGGDGPKGLGVSLSEYQRHRLIVIASAPCDGSLVSGIERSWDGGKGNVLSRGEGSHGREADEDAPDEMHFVENLEGKFAERGWFLGKVIKNGKRVEVVFATRDDAGNCTISKASD